jgi:hypothetical protein
MKVINVFLFAVISVCCTKRDSGAVKAEFHGNRDSLLVSFLLTQFQSFHYNKSSIEEQLKWLRSGFSSTYTRSNAASFRNFHFKSFRFDSQAHAPFAIEVTDDEDNLLSLFTFTDEIYYNNNSLASSYISDCFILDSLSADDSTLFQNVNLERNLNALIRKLNLERDENATLAVIDLIFRKLLEMEPYEDSEIAMIAETIEQNYGEPRVVELICSEYNQFINSPSEDVLRFRIHEGFAGYWRIWTEETDGVNTVKATFFSDVLFTRLYL